MAFYAESMKVIEHEDYINVNLYDEGIRACAEVSRIPGQKSLWFFNRLIVDPPTKRGKGYGRRLLNELLRIMQEHGNSLINEVSDYGSGDTSKLIKWYETFGFYEIEEPGVLKWDPKVKNPLITRDIDLILDVWSELGELIDHLVKHKPNDTTKERWHNYVYTRPKDIGISTFNLYVTLNQRPAPTMIDINLLYRALAELEVLYKKATPCHCDSTEEYRLIVNTAQSITKLIHLKVSHYWTFPS